LIFKHVGFEKALHDNWTDNIAIVPALRSLFVVLNKWSREVFGNLLRRKRKLWARIQGIQRQLSNQVIDSPQERAYGNVGSDRNLLDAKIYGGIHLRR